MGGKVLFKGHSCISYLHKGSLHLWHRTRHEVVTTDVHWKYWSQHLFTCWVTCHYPVKKASSRPTWNYFWPGISRRSTRTVIVRRLRHFQMCKTDVIHDVPIMFRWAGRSCPRATRAFCTCFLLLLLVTQRIVASLAVQDIVVITTD